MTEVESVYCAVRVEHLNKTDYASSLKDLFKEFVVGTMRRNLPV
jgi:hypothetical protein